MAIFVSSLRGAPRGFASSLTTTASEGNYIFVPKTWRYNTDKRGIIFCHGATASGAAAGMANNLGTVADRTGMVLASPDLTGSPGGLAAFGNDSSLTKVTDQWNVLKSTYGVKTDKMVLFGQSMGAATALMYAQANPSNVAAIYLELPAISVDDIHDNDRLSQAANIATAYGGSPAWETAKTARDPALNHTAHNTNNIPTLIYYGGADPFCLPAFVTAFDAAVASCTAISLGAGVGHDAATVDPVARASFLHQYSR